MNYNLTDALFILMGSLRLWNERLYRYTIRDVKLIYAIDSHNPRLILSNICGKTLCLK